MIPPERLAEQLAVVAHVDLLVARDVVRAWRRLRPESRLSVDLIPDLVSAIADIATAYGEVSGTVAADFYDFMAAAGGRRLPPAVPANPVPPRVQVEKLAAWATGPLRFADPLPDQALARVVGVTQRLAQQPRTSTVINMARRDRTRWAVVPQGKTCAFCLMLASRGAVYWSEESASAFKRRHTHCDCAFVPIFQPDDLPQINRELHEEWSEATHGHSDQAAAWNEHVTTAYGGVAMHIAAKRT